MPMKLVKSESDFIKYNLLKFIYPILLLFGIIGNLISFLVMVRIYYRGKNFKQFALSLAALSIADLGILVFACLMEYLEEFLQFHIKSSHLIVCKMFFFVCYLFSSFSAFLHAFIAAERWMVVAVPLKSKSTCTFRFNQLMIILIFFICGVRNILYNKRIIINILSIILNSCLTCHFFGSLPLMKRLFWTRVQHLV
jgi:hypothetical protein